MSQRLHAIAQTDLGDGYSDFAELADGSNSLVCSALRRADCKEVAIKIIDCRYLFEDSMEVLRLLREILSLEYFTKTKAGAVVEIFSSYFNATDEILYLVTEKMDFSLDHLLDVRTLTLEEARIVFYEISLLTAFEHQCAWAHRDRKPDNVLFSVNGGLLPAMKDLGIIQVLVLCFLFPFPFRVFLGIEPRDYKRHQGGVPQKIQSHFCAMYSEGL